MTRPDPPGDSTRRGLAAGSAPRILVLLGPALLTAACAGPDRFRWEVYEESLYSSCASRDADPAGRARLLGAEMDRAAGRGLAIPPGVRAELGRLRLEAGDLPGAREMLLAEKAAYPEAGRFMDRLLARLGP